MISLTSPVETRAHAWPAGAKLGGLCLATAALFYLDSLALIAAVAVLILTLYSLPGRSFMASGLRRLARLWPFLIVVIAWAAIEGRPAHGLGIALRMISAVALANLVTMTTRLTDMVDVVAFLCRPFRRLGLQTRALEIAIALVIRMTPVLLDRAEDLMQAWRARSRRRPGWRIILPFTLLAFDDAERVSEALKARGGLISNKET
ncbi:energy-coupling factor transporter transmembrane component T [uncultured Jannaschia sp.]|uniref:energy-coupling factor transporter transmembrane component T family protein n=1 Tax=uncultured Jannaschia sp. TaxID=293347 RepID=UPI00262D4F41|nr:energy-coupling factor transporter transmembrane component T [uncultured Jannaschia sp.]